MESGSGKGRGNEDQYIQNSLHKILKRIIGKNF